MWYVIQTISGEEELIKKMLEVMMEKTPLWNCFIPMHENVWIKGGQPHISEEKLFKGYLFIETEEPEKLFYRLKEIYHLSNLMNDRDEHGYTFLTITPAEEEFFQDVFDSEYMMRLSWVHKGKNGRIDKARGPIANYVNKISKVDWHHKRAFVDMELFGRVKRVKFGITLDKNELSEKGLRNIEQELAKDRAAEAKKAEHEENTAAVSGGGRASAAADNASAVEERILAAADNAVGDEKIKDVINTENDKEINSIDSTKNIGNDAARLNCMPQKVPIDKWDWKARAEQEQKIKEQKKQQESAENFGRIKPGDTVKNITGIYGDSVYKVKSCNGKRHTVMVEAPMFGSLIEIEMKENEVEVQE